MPSWKKVIISGSNAALNSLNVTTSLTASGLHYPTVDNGALSFLQTDGSGNLSFQYVNANIDTIYNGESTTIVKGTPVYVSGSVGANPKVFRADAANPAKMPVVYIAVDNIVAASTGKGIILGQIDGVDTTGYPASTEIYVAPGGGWTSTRPTGTSIVQVLGIVTKEGSGGKGLVLNPGPANLPNINSGSVWVGNSNSYPTAVATSSLNVNSASFATTASYALAAGSTSAVAGTTNYVPKFTSGTTIGNSQIFDNGSQVGIGMTIPNTYLGVRANYAASSLVDLENTNATGNAAMDLFNAGTFIGTIGTDKALGLQYDAWNTGNHFFRTFGTTRMFISGSGNIGIRTTTPTSASLHVSGNVFATSFTGSLSGTASYASQALSSSFAISSSYAEAARTVGITLQDTTPITYNVTFAGASSGNQSLNVDTTALTYNPSTSTLTVPNLAGTASWATNASKVLVSTNAENVAFKVPFAATNVSTTGTYDLQQDSETTFTYNPSTNTLTVPNLAGTASWATNATTASFITGSNVFGPFGSNSITSASFAVSSSRTISASFALTASSVTTLNQNVVITGSLTVGATSTGASENTLTLGARDNGSEGGQLGLNAPGGTYTSASMIDNYNNSFRILKGTNAGSTGLVAQWNLHNTQMQLPGYTSPTSMPGTVSGLLAFDTSGNIITTTTGSGGSGVTINNNTDNYIVTATGTANTLNGESGLQYNGTSLTVTGQVTASGAIISNANGAMYFRGGDDAEFWDINVANTVGIYGQQTQAEAGLKLGSSGATLYGSGSRFGINTTTPTSASLTVNGNVWATSFTGSLFGTASWATNVVNNGVTSVGGTGTVNGITLTGTVTSTGNLTLGGTLSGIENSQLTNSSITVGSTAISLGSSATTIAGLTSVTSTSFTGSLFGTASWATNASTATSAATLTTARNINGTSFNGSADITTANWGTTRTITIGSTGKSVNGSGNVSWSLAEIGAQAALTNPVTGTGANGRVAFWTGTTSQSSNANFFWDNSNGRLGIGTASPFDMLDVNGSIRFRANTPSFTAAPNSGVLDFVPTSIFPTDPQIRLAAVGTPTIGASIVFQTGINSGSISERMRITPSGSVGIGTNSPTYRLQVSDTIASVTAFGNFAALQAIGGAGYRWSLNNDSTFRLNRTTNGFSSVTTPIMVDSSDRVGIGTTSMVRDFQVGAFSGSPEICIASSTTGTGAISFGDGASGNDPWRGYVQYNHTSDYMFFGTANGQRLQITSGGAMGLGIAPTNTSGRFEASNDIVAYSSSDKNWKKNIKNIDSPLEKLSQINGVEFDWIEDEPVHGNKGNDIGVIAQEIEQVLPQIVQTRESGMKAVQYDKIIPLLIESIKEQQKQIDELKQIINGFTK